MYKEMRLLHEENNRASRDRENSYKEQSKNKLSQSIEKKIRTTFIGSLDSIEKHMGDLWGHSRNSRELSSVEQHWKEIWHLLREEILNKGNNQLRAALAEISEYDIKWNKKQITFILEGENRE